MTISESRNSQRPYRYGLILLCSGALINWLGLTENYAEPIRYIGVASIVGGALLICTAMLCWLHTSNHETTLANARNSTQLNQTPIQVIAINEPIIHEKPPEYDSVVANPPSYDDAIRLSPTALLPLQIENKNDLNTISSISNNSNNSYNLIRQTSQSSDGACDSNLPRINNTSVNVNIIN